jgi:tetratricopeptide (TPR) repeat protein
MKKTLVIAIGVLIMAAALPAQEWKGQGRIPGIVVDEKGDPIDGVRIKFFCPKFEGGFETKSGKDGRWLGAWMRSALWNIDFDKIGYAPAHKSLQMNQFEKYKEMRVVMRKIEGLVVSEDMKKDLTAANDIYDKKDYAAAIEAYKAFLVKFPDAYFIWRNIGNSYFLLEKYDEAEAAYKEVLAKNPGDVESTIGIGNCYSNRGNTAAALEWYGKVTVDKIDDPNLLYSVGMSYFQTQKLPEAAAFFEKAVSLDENQTDALYQLGITYTAQQQKDKAIATFEKYLKVDPDSERAAQVKSFLDYLKK